MWGPGPAEPGQAPIYLRPPRRCGDRALRPMVAGFPRISVAISFAGCPPNFRRISLATLLPLLLCYRPRRRGLPSRAERVAVWPITKISGCPGNVQVGADHDPGRPGRAPHRAASLPAKRQRRLPSDAAAAVARSKLHAIGITAGNGDTSAHLDTKPLQRFLPPWRRAPARKTARMLSRASLDKIIRELAQVDVLRKSRPPPSLPARQWLQPSRRRSTAADDDEGRQTLALGFIRVSGLGVLQGDENPPAQLGGIVDLLQAGRDGLPLVVPEIGMARSGRRR